MTPRERFFTTLRGEIPDRVPYVEILINEEVAQRLTGEERQFSELEIAELFGKDNVMCWTQPGVRFFTEDQKTEDGRTFRIDGTIKTEKDLERVEFDDLDAADFFDPAKAFLAEMKPTEYAVGTIISVGIDPVMHNMGLETFWMALYDNPSLVEAMLDRTTEWLARYVSRLCDLGFEYMWAGDDIAYKNGPMFSPDTFRSLVLPYLRRVAEAISVPWIFHSDGNLVPIMDDVLSLDMDAVHPIEPGAMDIAEIKKRWGSRITIVGNVDLNLLTLGSEEDVEDYVRWLMEVAKPGGRFMVSSANSVASYCKPENALAMSRAVRTYGSYDGGPL